MEENSESIDRFFFDGGGLELKGRMFQHGKSIPWMSLGYLCVATSVEHYVQPAE